MGSAGGASFALGFLAGIAFYAQVWRKQEMLRRHGRYCRSCDSCIPAYQLRGLNVMSLIPAAR